MVLLCLSIKEQPARVLSDLPLSCTHVSSQVRSSQLAQAKVSTSKLLRVHSGMGVQHTNETETGGLSVDINDQGGSMHRMSLGLG